MAKTCARCETTTDTRALFCPDCGALYDRDELQRVRIMGPVGVAHSNSPKIAQFFETGDPAVFD